MWLSLPNGKVDEMANGLETLSEAARWRLLVDAAKQAAETAGYKLSRIPGRGLSNIWNLTKDGKTHDFNVTSINASTIEGKRESISIDQIASIQKRTVSMGKTALAIAFPVVVAAVVVLAVCSLRGNPSSMSRASGHSGRVAQPVTPLLQPLPSPPQNSQLQRCDGPSGESDSAHVRRCAT